MGRTKITAQCENCNCIFELELLKKGEEYQNLVGELFCPFCGTMFKSHIGF